MNAGKRVIVGALSAVLSGLSARGTLSEPVVIDSDFRSSRWVTAFTNQVALAWNWNESTTQVRLEIAGMGGLFATNFTTATSNYLWKAFPSAVPAADDVYALTLTICTNGSAVAEVQTSRVAIVKGAFGAAWVNAVCDSPAWARVNDSAAIPFDAAFCAAATAAPCVQLVISKRGGSATTNVFSEAAGYCGWKLLDNGWGFGTFDLSLSFAGTEGDALTASVTRLPCGTMLRVR